MTERTINNYLNRKFIYLFIILTIIVILSVIFLIQGYMQARISDYIYELTVDSINSSISHFDETLSLVENSYDKLAAEMIQDFKNELTETSELSVDDTIDIDRLFFDIIDVHESELSTIGILEQTNSAAFYYIFNEKGEIIHSNSRIKEEINNKKIINSSIGYSVVYERFRHDDTANLFVKNVYLRLSEEYLIALCLPMDRNLFDKILKRFQELENNFPFIKNIESFKTTQGEFADGLNEDDIKMIGNTPVIIRGDADYNYTYYTAWNYFEDDDEYISSDTFFIKMEMDFSQEMHAFNRVLTIFISVVLFIAILTIFLINRRLIKKISAPFSYLAENMSKMGSHDLSTIDEKLERTDLKEVNMLLASYQEMTSELASSFEELKAVNDELEESYTETSILAENLHNVIQVATKLSDAVFDEKENFLVELFYVAEKLIPEADYGTVLLVENKQVKWLEAIGHNLEEIKKIPIKPDFFKAQDELIYIKDIDDEDTSIPYQGLMEELLENKRPIKSSLSVQLYVGDELAGLLNYDIAASSDDNFSRQSVETIKAFANLASAFLTIQSYKHIQEKFQREIILAIINILEIHDSYTKGHSENVARISALLAKEMGFSNEEVENIEWAGLVHDIGKILVSKDILNKPGALTVDEYKEIKKHTVWGYEVLVSSEELRDIAVSVRHHHERWDGDGYPDGLRGEQIPLFARIITLADAWDTMRSDRVYRKKLDKELAFKEVKDNIGKQFDPEVAKVAVRLIEEGKLS